MLACNDAVPMSRPPARDWKIYPYRLSPQQKLELHQVWRQGTGLTMLGAVGGAALSMLSHCRYPRSRMTHAWQAVENATLGSFMGASVPSALMKDRFKEANRQRNPFSWHRIKQSWMERKAKKKEGREGSQSAQGLKRWWVDRKERKAENKEELKASKENR